MIKKGKKKKPGKDQNICCALKAQDWILMENKPGQRGLGT